MELLKLTEDRLPRQGLLPWAVRDEHGTLLVGRGQALPSPEALAALLERGAFVSAQEMRAVLAEREAQRRVAGHQAPDPARPVTAHVPVAGVPDNLFGDWERELARVERVLRSVDQPGFAERVDGLACEIGALSERDADIALYICVRQDPRRLGAYGIAHAMHCALVCQRVARRLGWDDARLVTLMKAALTMNVSMIELQGRMATQGVPPTERQQAAVRAHPGEAVALLRGTGVSDPDWLRAVMEHHESRGGAGYPSGLEEPGALSLLLHHVDVFTAKISPRASRPPIATPVVARELFREDGGGPISAALIKEFGLYPPGELVTLRSGEHAVVVRRTASATTPVVASITDRHGLPLVRPVLRETAQPAFGIVGCDRERGLLDKVMPDVLYGLAH